MKFVSLLPSLWLTVSHLLPATTAAPCSGEPCTEATPTLYLCGDSTMAKSPDGVIDGWGNHAGKYTTITTVNEAIGGRSARSYWNEGRFQAVADLAKAGDIVVIEFGHNDGNSPEIDDNGRSDCPGAGSETCHSDKTGEIVYTFNYYINQAIKLYLAKEVSVILSSQTPNNPWETGKYIANVTRFIEYQKAVADALNNPSVTFVDHFQAVSNMYLKLGNTSVNALFPKDHTHTNANGADLVAQAFMQAIYQKMNGTTSLLPHLKQPVKIVY